MIPKWIQEGSLNPFKNHTNLTLDPRCATRCPRASLNHQNGIPRSSNAPSIPSKFQIWVPNMTPYSYQHPANQPATPCNKGGRRQGRSLKISAAPGFSLPLGVLDLPSRYPYQGSPKGSPPPSCTPLPPAFRHQHISKKGPGNQAGKMIAKICKKVAQGHPRVPNQTKSRPKMTP